MKSSVLFSKQELFKMHRSPNRRDFMKSAFASGLGSALALSGFSRSPLFAEEGELPPIRQITHGPKHHWFGYYDKLQFDPTCRFVLGMEVDFEGRSPRADDVIRIGMIDLEDDDRWIELGTSSAWGWQQGCMLQWLPGSKSEIIWNDRQGDHYVSHILDIHTRERRTIDHPVYAVSPCGTWAVTADFRRIDDMRPGYGYAGLPDPAADQLAPENAELVVPLSEAAAVPFEKYDLTGAKHYFNHLLVSPDGRRFEFLHRWRKEGLRSFGTRMFTCAADGSDRRVIDPSGHTSHFIWRDPDHILAWTKPEGKDSGFWLFEDRVDGNVEPVGKGIMTRNGHCTYLPGNEWILNDTYPDKERLQHPYLYHVPTEQVHPLGRFYLPPEYKGEWRCDTHPRYSPDGKSVTIDSPHTGQGRQIFLIDISGIVG
jgi:hypothetical protein